ncbi:AI-2E family transporter [Halorussus halobius]|uniref:AI-2E family transporter n=1 Tax=Halorussus halobius TaxID=1710537 RepID=UPI00143CF64D|nr:AI-2E family transporter [Halorussus halobius]
MDPTNLVDRERNRIAWWLYLAGLGAGVAFLGYSFVGTFALGTFVYYAARPIFRRLRSRLGRDDLAAGATLLGFVVPVLAIVVYVLAQSLRDVASLAGTAPDQYAQLLAPFVDVAALTEGQQDLLTSLLNRPGAVESVPVDRVRSLLTGGLSVVGTVFGVFVHVSLTFGFAFFLLRDGDRIAAWFRNNVAGEGTTGHAYATAVDDDLESVFFGNVLFVFVMAVLAAVVYYGFNLLAPPALSIPFAVLLALLTGVASLIPLVVSKVVYVPLVAYLASVALGTGGVALVYPLGLLVVSFLVLDILPQTFLQPYISGRQIHTGLMMFAYILGPLLFGWYGFFLLPIFVVLVLQAVRIVLTSLLHGDRLTPEVEAAPTMGGEPSEADTPDEGDAPEAGGEPSDRDGSDGDHPRPAGDSSRATDGDE